MNSSASELPEGSCISRFGVSLWQENWKGARVMVVRMVNKVRSCDYGSSDDASNSHGDVCFISDQTTTTSWWLLGQCDIGCLPWLSVLLLVKGWYGVEPDAVAIVCIGREVSFEAIDRFALLCDNETEGAIWTAQSHFSRKIFSNMVIATGPPFGSAFWS